ncbi:MAG: hypothetical protein MMC33_000341 [Icmadophila ericetorum]|nr:hypothetical protein [Icmadophila ericetorum]
MERFPLVTPSNCNCHLSIVWNLLRVQELTGEEGGSFEVLLGLIERTQSDCTAVLRCDTCRQVRFSLVLITLVSGILVEQLEACCNGIGLCQNSEPSTAASSSGLKASLGDYELDDADSRLLARELIGLRMRQFSEVMVLLQNAITEVQSMNKSDDLLQDSKTGLVCLESIKVHGDRLSTLLQTLGSQNLNL